MMRVVVVVRVCVAGAGLVVVMIPRPQDNHIDDPEILSVVYAMPSLAVLYLKGNPCVRACLIL
jgi:hypothetical protein